MSFVPPPFPKIPAYRRDADPVHHARAVVCLEKIDGSNTRIGIPRHAQSAQDIVLGGRTRLENEPEFSQPHLRRAFFDPARSRALLDLARTLQGDLTLYGETCGRGIQATGFLYGPLPHFVVFAATISGAWLGWSHSIDIPGDDTRPPQKLPSLCNLAEQAHLPLAPVLYRGAPDPDTFDALLDRDSALAASRGTLPRHGSGTHEGIVIWSDPILFDGAGQLLVAKHKHPNRRETLETSDGSDSLESFTTRVVTLERARHARQHLEENGRWSTLLGERIQALVKRIVQDIAREEPSYQEQIATHGKATTRASIERIAQDLAEKLARE